MDNDGPGAPPVAACATIALMEARLTTLLEDAERIQRCVAGSLST